MAETENRAALQLQLAQPRIDDAPGEDNWSQPEDFDFAGFDIDFHFAADRTLMPVHRTDTLSGLQVQTAARAEGAAADQVALIAAQRNLAIAD